MTSSIHSFTLGDFTQLSYHNPGDLALPSAEPLHTCNPLSSNADQIFMFVSSDTNSTPITVYLVEEGETQLKPWKKRTVRKKGNPAEIIFNGSLLKPGDKLYVYKDNVTVDVVTVYGYVRRAEVDDSTVTTTNTKSFSEGSVITSSGSKVLIHSNNTDRKHLIHLNVDSADGLINYTKALSIKSAVYKPQGRFMYNHFDRLLSENPTSMVRLFEESSSVGIGLNYMSTQVRLNDLLQTTSSEQIRVEEIGYRLYGDNPSADDTLTSEQYNSLNDVHTSLHHTVVTGGNEADPQSGVLKVGSTMRSSIYLQRNEFTTVEVAEPVNGSGGNTYHQVGDKWYMVAECFRQDKYVVFKRNNQYTDWGGNTHQVIPAIYQVNSSFFLNGDVVVSLKSDNIDGIVNLTPVTGDVGFLATSISYRNVGSLVNPNDVEFVTSNESDNVNGDNVCSYVMLPWDSTNHRVTHPHKTLNGGNIFPLLQNMMKDVTHDILELAQTSNSVHLEMRSGEASVANILETDAGEDVLLKITRSFKIPGQTYNGVVYNVIDEIGSTGDDDERRTLLADTLYAGSVVVEQYQIYNNVSLLPSGGDDNQVPLNLSDYSGAKFYIAFEKWYKVKRAYDPITDSFGDPPSTLERGEQFEILSTEEHTFLHTPVNKSGGRTTRVLQNVCVDPNTSLWADEQTNSVGTNFSGYIIEVNNS